MQYLDRMPAAIVQILRPETEEFVGLGFIAPKELVITAAHNLAAPDSGSGLYDFDAVPIKVSSGHRHVMEPIFVDQCQDVAVLAIHDSDFCEDHHLLELEAIPLFWGPIVGDQVGSLWTPDRGAIPVKFRMPGGPQLLLDTGSNVSNGTSGGPILDNTGAAVAVFSMDQGIAGADSYLLSKGPCLSQCLPPWVAKLLRS